MTIVYEVEAYPDPTCLTGSDLKALNARYESHKRTAEAIGVSRAYVSHGSKFK
jgi:hypothetical protein